MIATCPSPTQLKGLLDSSVTPQEQAQITAHLDSCTECQVKLEQLAAGKTDLIEIARQANGTKSTPDQTSAFWPAYKSVESSVRILSNETNTLIETPVDAPPSSPASFDFLDAPENDRYLGSLDRFQFVELVGKGGMGMVFRAVDACLQRTVAVKILDPQYSKNELAQTRFCREARAAAGVTHENVVTIHHVEHDETKDISYIVMQFVKGRSLQELLDSENPITIREAVRIAAAIAAGLAAAHSNGLIHRDIKPGNILIEQTTGRVLLTDFGLARLNEDVKITQTGYVAGTPLYMSPEQARGDTLDFHTDMFSLGGVLYAMLTGMPPFQGSSPFVVLKHVTDRRHRPIHDSNPDVPSGVAEIVDRLLEKEPRHRYDSAAEVAALLNNELIKLPAEAVVVPRKPRSSISIPRYVRSWWRRYSSTALFALLALLLVGLVSEAFQWTGFTRLGQRGLPPQYLVSADGAEIVPENDPSLVETFGNLNGTVWGLAFSPNEEILAAATDNGIVKLFNYKTKAAEGELVTSVLSPIWSISFNGDGTQLATGSDDGLVRIWDVKTQKVVKTLEHTSSVRTATFSLDGTKIASGLRNGHLIIWDVASGKAIHKIDQNLGGAVYKLAFSPDGNLLASGGTDQKVRIWNVKTGNVISTMDGHKGSVYSLTFDISGKQIASVGWDHLIHIWDATSGAKIKTIDPKSEDLWAVAFCPCGNYILIGSQDRKVRWVDINTEKVVKIYTGHTGAVHSVAVSNDAGYIAAGGRDGVVKVWKTEKKGE
jgi:serine/threonine protein kinase